jgi:hypothetical protein
MEETGLEPASAEWELRFWQTCFTHKEINPSFSKVRVFFCQNVGL